MVLQRHLDARSTLTGKEVCSHEDMMNQQGKSLYRAFFHDTCGIGKVGDLVSKDTIFLGSEKIFNAKLTAGQYFLLLGVVSATPNE